MKIIDKFYKILPAYSNWKFWITLAFFIKLVFFLLKLYEQHSPDIYYPESFAFEGGDTKSYFDPIENLLKNGTYFDDYRMPGYGWLYFILRLFLEQTNALNFLIVVQLILSSISVYVLGLISIKLFKNSGLFFLSFFIYSISTFVSLYDTYLLTESFATSCMIFSLYFILSDKNWNILFSGILITWLIFLKPVMAPLLLIFSLFILFKKSSYVGFKLIKIIIFISPFIILDGIWLIRNYEKHERFIPLTQSVYYPTLENTYVKHLFQFLNSFGGSIVAVNPNSEITFFTAPLEKYSFNARTDLPEEIYTTQFNKDSLIKIKQMISIIEAEKSKDINKDSLEYSIISKLNTYTLSIKNEKPYLYYIGSRIKVFKTFFVHFGTYNLFMKSNSELSVVGLMIKAFYSILYIFCVLFGFLGIIFLIIKSYKNLDILLFLASSLYLSLIFPIGLKMDEYRYFVTAYPLFVLSAVYFFGSIYNYFNFKNKNA